MKATVTIALLSAALSRLKMVATRQATLPILSCVLIESVEGGLRLCATDLDSFLSVEIDADVHDSGSVVAPCRLLAEALAKIEGSDISLIATKKGRLLGNSGAFNFDLFCLPVAEFPVTPAMEGAMNYCFDEGHLAENIGRQLSSVSSDATRYVLNGILFSAAGGNLEMIATDGKRMAMTQVATNWQHADLQFIVPHETASMIARLDAGGATEISVNAGKIQASGKGWKLVSKLIEGDYPNWKQVVPPATEAHVFKVNREGFIAALKFAATVCVAHSQCVKLQLSDGQISCEANRAYVGVFSAKVDADISGGDLCIAFNPIYLIEALSVMIGEKVTGSLADDKTPMMLTDTRTENVLMPMRVDL